MRSYYLNTPYNLNLKLKSLHNAPIARNKDINKLYNNLDSSIPALTNQFFILKKRTKQLNNSLTRIPLVNTTYNNLNINTSKSYCNSYSKSYKTSPKFLNYNYSYISPKPLVKTYTNINNNKNQNTNINYKYNDAKYRDCNENIKNNNNHIRLNFEYGSGLRGSINNEQYNSRYNNLNYLKKDEDKNYNLKNYEFNYEDNYNNNKRKREEIKAEYDKKFEKLNEKIYEKDKLINNMKGIIDNTMDKLNKKNKDNILLQNEISELETRNTYIVNNDINLNKNNNYNNNYDNRYNNINNNNIINNRIKKYKNDRKYYNENNRKNSNEKVYNNSYLNKSSYEEKMDLKWEEIRKLNRKMDNLLMKNKNKL